MTAVPIPDFNAIAEALLRSRYRPEVLPVEPGTGVYAFFIEDGAELPRIKVPSTGLLYVGMTNDSLEVRNHFTHEESGFSPSAAHLAPF